MNIKSKAIVAYGLIINIAWLTLLANTNLFYAIRGLVPDSLSRAYNLIPFAAFIPLLIGSIIVAYGFAYSSKVAVEGKLAAGVVIAWGIFIISALVCLYVTLFK